MFTLPELPYDYDALAPFINGDIQHLHHDKHHRTYVDTLNKALEKYPDWQNKTIEELVTSLDQIPKDIRTVVRNHGGGHINHSMFWVMMWTSKCCSKATSPVCPALGWQLHILRRRSL